MRSKPVIAVLLFTLSGCDATATSDATTSPDAQARFHVDPERITVSGISSGAYMAGQFHLAHSALVGGAGLLAGGPYACAGGSMSQALGPCVKGNDLDVASLVAQAERLSGSGQIDDVANLRDDRVWIFHGAADATVGRGVSLAAGEFYRRWLPEEQVAVVTDVEVVHGMPTRAQGQPCDTFAAPYLNACEYDAAGELLQHLYGALHEPGEATLELLPVSQASFADAELTDTAWLYAPADCRDGAACGLHIAFHGCGQSDEYIGDAFVTGAGYNEWAETNRLLVLYPQVKSSKLAPVNPLGCWDWWGYTGEAYATRAGAQIAAIRGLVESLTEQR